MSAVVIVRGDEPLSALDVVTPLPTSNIPLPYSFELLTTQVKPRVVTPIQRMKMMRMLWYIGRLSIAAFLSGSRVPQTM